MTSGSVLCMTPATSIGRFQPFFICLLYDIQCLRCLTLISEMVENDLGSRPEGFNGFRLNV